MYVDIINFELYLMLPTQPIRMVDTTLNNRIRNKITHTYARVKRRFFNFLYYIPLVLIPLVDRKYLDDISCSEI